MGFFTSGNITLFWSKVLKMRKGTLLLLIHISFKFSFKVQLCFELWIFLIMTLSQYDYFWSEHIELKTIKSRWVISWLRKEKSGKKGPCTSGPYCSADTLLSVLGLNPEHHTCWASTLSLSYILSSDIYPLNKLQACDMLVLIAGAQCAEALCSLLTLQSHN